jgi:hypothetical protein
MKACPYEGFQSATRASTTDPTTSAQNHDCNTLHHVSGMQIIMVIAHRVNAFDTARERVQQMDGLSSARPLTCVPRGEVAQQVACNELDDQHADRHTVKQKRFARVIVNIINRNLAQLMEVARRKAHGVLVRVAVR